MVLTCRDVLQVTLANDISAGQKLVVCVQGGHLNTETGEISPDRGNSCNKSNTREASGPGYPSACSLSGSLPGLLMAGVAWAGYGGPSARPVLFLASVATRQGWT